VSSSTGLFTVGTPVVYGGQYSVAPAITRLSETSFAISYYDTNSAGSSVLVTRRGLVNPNDLSITLSDEVLACDNIGYGIYQTLVGLSSDLYLIGYYNGTSTSWDEPQTGPLSVITVTIDGTGSPVVGSTATLANTIAAFNLASARVDNSSALITFADVSTDFGVTTILVSIDPTSGQANFGSSVLFSSGRTLSIVQSYLIMDLDVVVISTPSSVGANPSPVKFLVIYSDISNKGILTTSVGSVLPPSLSSLLTLRRSHAQLSLFKHPLISY
jgi:hypothetical protein